MSRNAFEASTAEGGTHRRLAQLAGEWQGTTRVWFDPAQPPASETPQRGSIRAILGGRFLLHEYETSVGDDAHQGLAIYGAHLDANAFESAWVDSFHTGTSVMFSVAASKSRYSVLGSYGDGQGGPRWGWRTDIDQPDADTLLITMFNITPQGDEAKAVETRYRRVN
ncbi:MAG: DUF1579 domain-containing protein [Burkholderiales bacterium]